MKIAARKNLNRLFALFVCLGISCSIAHAAETKSVYTSLKIKDCKKLVDLSDPNQSTYESCPGVGGYVLEIHLVDSGRSSITVIDPAKKEHPLGYEHIVTPSMFHLGDKAEWRVRNKGGKSIPVALIVGVKAHENPKDPAKVTNDILAIAKITRDVICVTDSLRHGALSKSEVDILADAAADKACAPGLPLAPAQ